MRERSGSEPEWRRRSSKCVCLPARLSWLFACLVAFLGCRSRAPESPRRSAERFAEATLKGDGPAVHAMLTREGRAQYSASAVQSLLNDGGRELKLMSEQVMRDPSQCRFGRARLRLREDGAELSFLEEEGGYRVSAAPGAAIGEALGDAPPEVVLAELGRALETLDLPRILSLLSSERKKDIVSRLERLASELRHSTLGRVETTATGYVVTLRDGTRILLVAEAEGYRIVHIQ
jgi:hypothetical protein